jgi:hypothetical protein
MLVRLWLFLLTVPLWGHDIAGDVKVQAYLKPEGQTMRVVLRVPLVAMRDAVPARCGDDVDHQRDRTV